MPRRDLNFGDETVLVQSMPNQFTGLKAGPAAAAGEQELRTVPLSQIVTESPLQSRAPFDPEHDPDDAALVESLRANLAAHPQRHPQEQPVVLGRISGSEPAQFAVIAGHRRLAALRHIGFKTCLAVIRKETSLEADILTLTENVRKNLRPLEQARALERLRQHDLKKLKLTFEEITRRVGLGRQYAYELLDLLKLPAELQQAVGSGQLSARTANLLAGAETRHVPELTRMAVSSGWSREEAARAVGRIKAKKESPLAAARALGLDRSDGNAPAPDVKTPGRGQAKKAKRPARGAQALALDTVAAIIAEFCPDLDSRKARALGESAVRRKATVPIVKLAGLLVSNYSPAESVDLAGKIAATPAGRRIVSLMDEVAALQEMAEGGQLAPEAGMVLTELGRRLVSFNAASPRGK